LAHETDANGVPVLPQALARFDCLQVATHDGGDHLIIVGRVLRVSARPGQPLLCSQGEYGRFAPGL
jgi:flavin reductase (DIM6/NTAB) family NADH-FMN oxidoreductase RutF